MFASGKNAISTQKFLTALDMLPSKRAQLDSLGDARAAKEYHDTLQSLFDNAQASDLPKLARYLDSSGLGQQRSDSCSA